MNNTAFSVKISETRREMGIVSAADTARAICSLLEKKEYINMIFAAAPSQLDLLCELVKHDEVDFGRINAFHMDEYIGLAPDAPQGFGNFLYKYLFSKVNFRSVHYLNREGKDAALVCSEYEKLLCEYPVDIVCMGIGENGHIAFNDPAEADFNDKRLVKIVNLDDVCRMQQVNDKCFEKISDVPTQAVTLTVPALIKAEYNFCVVPTSLKANAVRDTVYGPISEACPASSLRLCKNATLYTDTAGAKYILK